MNARIIHGDSLKKLKKIPDNFFDSVVCDPPYGLLFMGKKWDYQVPSVELWAEILRVLKPGGHCLSFGGTRTYHRMVVNMEDAEFEIRDQLQWIFGSGFPKSHNIGKGRGTALKPANEPIVLARKPLSESTVAKNVLRWGTGALNVDASRIAGEPWKAHSATGLAETKFFTDGNAKVIDKEPHTQGRWPANVLFDESAAEMLDAQSGTLKSGEVKPYKNNGGWKNTSEVKTGTFAASSGGASRFFYVAKASKRERNAGLEGMPLKAQGAYGEFAGDGRGRQTEHQPTANFHPTVKPIKLMEYLITLITPPGGIVLDPFAGSGSTGVAAKRLKRKFIGIEMSPEYCKIARRRLCQKTA